MTAETIPLEWCDSILVHFWPNFWCKIESKSSQNRIASLQRNRLWMTLDAPKNANQIVNLSQWKRWGLLYVLQRSLVCRERTHFSGFSITVGRGHKSRDNYLGRSERTNEPHLQQHRCRRPPPRRNRKRQAVSTATRDVFLTSSLALGRLPKRVIWNWSRTNSTCLSLVANPCLANCLWQSYVKQAPDMAINSQFSILKSQNQM